MRQLVRAIRTCSLRNKSASDVLVPQVDGILSKLLVKRQFKTKSKQKLRDENLVVPCPSQYKQLFLWDAVTDATTSSWFEVRDLHEVTSAEEEVEWKLADSNTNRIFYLDAGAIQRFLI